MTFRRKFKRIRKKERILEDSALKWLAGFISMETLRVQILNFKLQISQACTKHYVLISSNSGINKVLTKYLTWLSPDSWQSKIISKFIFIADSVEFNIY